MFMLTHFGWKAVVGTLVANLVYFVAFRHELKSLQEAFALKNLKDEIQQRYLKRVDMESMMDDCMSRLEGEFHFVDAFTEKLKEAARNLTRRLEERAMADLKDK